MSAETNGGAPEASSGEATGPMTFEKMVSGDTEVVEEKGSKVVEETEEVDGDSEDTDGGGSEDSEGDSSEGDEEDTSSTEEKKEDPEEPSKETEELEKLSTDAKDGVKVLHKGKAFKIPADAKITITKGDKQISFSLKEVGNNVLTKREIDQEFSRLDRDKKTFERERREITKVQIENAELEDKLSLIQEAASSGNVFDIAQATLGLFSNGDVAVSQKLFDQLVDLTEKVSGMTEEQLKAAINHSQLAFKNTKLERENKKATERLQGEENRRWLQSEISRHGIGWDEYVERYQALKELNRIRIQQGQPPRLRDDMTYQDVALETINWTLATRHYVKVVDAIKKVNPKESENNDLINVVSQLTDLSFSEKDIADIVRGVLGAPRKASSPKNSSMGVSSSNGKAPTKAPVKKEATPEKAPKGKEAKKDDDEDEGPLTFDKIKKRYS